MIGFLIIRIKLFFVSNTNISYQIYIRIFIKVWYCIKIKLQINLGDSCLNQIIWMVFHFKSKCSNQEWFAITVEFHFENKGITIYIIIFIRFLEEIVWSMHYVHSQFNYNLVPLVTFCSPWWIFGSVVGISPRLSTLYGHQRWSFIWYATKSVLAHVWSL